MASHRTILVTGAGGFIGGRIVEALSLSGFAKARAGIRRWSSAARISRFPVEIVPCDIMNEDEIAQAMDGVTSVVHCALGKRRDVNIQGTRNMLNAAYKLGSDRFVYLSTIEVYGNARGDVDETFPLQYTGKQYGDSKIEAEKICWEFQDKGLPIVVIRPSVVYGPFSKLWTIGYAARLQSGRWGVFKGYGEGICNLLCIDDLVSAIFLAISHKSAIGQAFNINGPERITWNQYFQRFNVALGLPPLREISPASAKLHAAIMEPFRSSARYLLNHFNDPIMKVYSRFATAKRAMRATEKSIRLTPILLDLSLYDRHAFYSISKARKLIGYNPKFSLADGLRMSVRWLDHHGLLA